MFEYIEKLTLTPYAMTKEDIDDLHGAGLDDEEILETVIVCSTFNYACRLVDGLGGVQPEWSDNRVLDQELISRGVTADPESRGL